MGRSVKLNGDGSVLVCGGNNIVSMFNYSLDNIVFIPPTTTILYGWSSGQYVTPPSVVSIYGTKGTVVDLDSTGTYFMLLTASGSTNHDTSVYKFDINYNSFTIQGSPISFFNNQPNSDVISDIKLSFSMSDDGNRIAIGKPLDFTVSNPNLYGSVSVYDYNGSNWVQIGNDIIDQGHNTGSYKTDYTFGNSVALNGDGTAVSVGAPSYGGSNVGSIYTFGAVTACVHGNTEVTTPQGNKKIKDIVKNDIVIDNFGMCHTVVNNVEFPSKGNYVLIKKDAIEQNFPSQDTYITAGHPILINGIEIPAKKLINNDTIIDVILPEQKKVYSLVTSERMAIMMNNMPVMTWKYEDLQNFMKRYAVYAKFL